MRALPHQFLSVTKIRFAPLRQSLGDDVYALCADELSCIRHVVRERGMRAALRLAWRAPHQRHRDMARGNVLRKSAQYQVFRRPWVQRLYAFLKAKHAQFAELVVSDTLARMQDPVCLVLNGFYVPDSVLSAVAPPHRRVFVENGFFKGTLQADPKGINDDNSLPRDPAFYRSYAPDHRPLDLTLNTRRPKHKTHARGTLPRRYIFVPFQVDSDSQITHQSPWIRDMPHLYEELREAVIQTHDLHLVIKEHPSQRRVLHGSVPAHPRILFQNGRSTEELIRGAVAVMTVNSTVGLEALARGKPVITLGKACYNIEGLVSHVTSREALHALLRQPGNVPFDADLTRRFLHFLYYAFLMPEAGHPLGLTAKEHITALTKRDFTGATQARTRAFDDLSAPDPKATPHVGSVSAVT